MVRRTEKGDPKHKVIIYFKWGGSDSAYDIEQSELERLKKDWLSYLETGKPRGGAYKATKTIVENPSTESLLKFDEVVAIGWPPKSGMEATV